MKILSVALVGALTFMSGCARKPPRPAVVPTSAVWVDGVFIECSVETASLANRCTVYNDSTGEILESGLFVLSGVGREARASELRYVAFDGTRIYLQDARALYPLRPEVPALEAKLTLLAGNSAIKCGRVRVHEDPTIASDCALKALAEKKPFYVYYVLQGFDSIVSVGLAGDASGQVYAVSYDSMGWSPAGLPVGAQLSGGNRILIQSCPEPVWKAPNGMLTCFPSKE